VDGNADTEIDRDVERNEDFLRLLKKKSNLNKKREEVFLRFAYVSAGEGRWF